MGSTLKKTQRNLSNMNSLFGCVKIWRSHKKRTSKPAKGTKPASSPAPSPTSASGSGEKDLRNRPAVSLIDGTRPGAMAMPEDPFERKILDNLGAPPSPTIVTP